VQTLAQIREMLESRGLAPRKSLGQNFLIDHNLIRKLVDGAAVGPGDAVLEVGPGTGTLTDELLALGAQVVACELDRGLAGLLRERLSDPQSSIGAPAAARFLLIEGDALAGKRALNPALLQALRPAATFKLVANLPYGAGTPVIMALLTDHAAPQQQPCCTGMFVTIQREVADRLMATPGSRDYGPLTIVAQAMAEVQRIAVLPPECFWPRPEVTSAMVSIVPREEPLTSDPRGLAEAVQQLFSSRRKQLGSVLGRTFPFPEGILPESRVESLSVNEILALARNMG
jgi:16S rRNA (adenine1518-N6/adenine1519-N6)-dimethyltransferase